MPPAAVTSALLGLALVLPLSAAPAARAEAPPHVRLVSFNLLHGGPASGWTAAPHVEERLQLVIDGLRALQPDVVALQEASVTRAHGNVARRIALALGLHHVHGGATRHVFPFPFGWLVTRLLAFDEGSAILSRFPIAGNETLPLPRCRERLDPRIVLRAELRTPAGPLAVYSTHTGRDDCQVRAAGEFVRERRGELPSLLMGDLNTGEGQPVLAELLEQGFVDVFRRGSPQAPGHTVWQRPRAPAPTVTRRVDFVLMLPGRRVHGSVRRSAVVLDTPRRQDDGTTVWPSDHYGILAEIDLAD